MVSSVITTLILLLAATATASAADFEVDMVNKAADGTMMAFDPPLTKVAVGDTVTFVAKDKGHDAMTISGMIPDGATAVTGQISQDLKVTFTVPGVYGIRCLPHFALGMVALVVVGDGTPPNLDAAKGAQLPPLAKKRLDPLWAQIR